MRRPNRELILRALRTTLPFVLTALVGAGLALALGRPPPPAPRGPVPRAPPPPTPPPPPPPRGPPPEGGG
jgi:hypothetical protein